jgi:glycerol-3-phosphate dehydrogenase (NAD(P)+)
MPPHPRPILIAGAGSWGTALAILMARNGQTAYLWGHRSEHVARLQRERQNKRYLAGVEFPEYIYPIDDLRSELSQVDDMIIAVPVKGLRSVLEVLGCNPVHRICWACKGVEAGTRSLVHEVVAEVCGPGIPMAVISGPTFAREVAIGRPAAVTIAANDAGFAEDLVARLHSGAFRAYTTDDIVGVEVAGSVKNVLAIAAGVSDGLGFGANTRAALITRGLVEMTRFGVALGGRRETFTGLAGLGDLVLTCTDNQSRNRRLGLALAEGRSLEEAVTAIGQVVEGVRTAREIDSLAREHGIEMPITEQVSRLVNGECVPHEAVQALLAREPKQEIS